MTISNSGAAGFAELEPELAELACGSSSSLLSLLSSSLLSRARLALAEPLAAEAGCLPAAPRDVASLLPSAPELPDAAAAAAGALPLLDDEAAAAPADEGALLDEDAPLATRLITQNVSFFVAPYRSFAWTRFRSSFGTSSSHVMSQ